MYTKKYLKYKGKYLALSRQRGGVKGEGGADGNPLEPDTEQYYADIQEIVKNNIEQGILDVNSPFYIEMYKCVIWHFLDGFIDSNIGSNSSKHIDTLKSNGLYDEEIHVIESYPTGTEKSNQYKKLVKIFTDTYILYERAVKLDNKTIILVNTYDHQMAVLIVNNQGKKYISLVNSGDGIQNHYNDNDMYNLWHTYELIPNKTEEILSRLALLMTFVRHTHIFRDLYRNSIELSINNGSHYKKNVFADLYKPIYFQNEVIQMNKSILNSLWDIIFKSLDEHEETLKLYYETFKILGGQVKTVGTIFNNESLVEYIKSWDGITKLFPKHHPFCHRNFVLNNGYLLTSPQISGSCSWFALFWSIIALKLKFDSPSNTIDYIKKLDYKFAEILYFMVSANYCYMLDTTIPTGKIISGDFYLLSDLSRKIGFNKQESSEIKRKISIEYTLTLSKLVKLNSFGDNSIIIKNIDFTRICVNLALKLRKGYVLSFSDISDEYNILTKLSSNTSDIIEYKKYFNTMFLTLNLLYYIYVIKKGVKTIVPGYTQKCLFLPRVSILYLTKEELYMSYDLIVNQHNRDNRMTHMYIEKELKHYKSYIFKFQEIYIESTNNPYDCYSNKIYYDLNNILFSNLDKSNIFYQLLRHNKERSQLYTFNMIYKDISGITDKRSQLYTFNMIYKDISEIPDYVIPLCTLLIPGINIRTVVPPILNGPVRIIKGMKFYSDIQKIISTDTIKKPSDLDNIVSKVRIAPVIELYKTQYLLKILKLDHLGKFHYNGSNFSIVNNDKNSIDFDIIFGLPSNGHNHYRHICKFVRDDNKTYIIVIDNPECSEEYTEHVKKEGDNVFLQKRLYIIEYSVNTNKWTVNGKEAILNPAIKLYPFMIFAPKNITKLVYRSGTSWNMLCFASQTPESIHIFPNKDKFLLLDLKISQNMITPIFTTRSMKILQKMYKNYGGYAPALGLLDNSNIKSFSFSGNNNHIIKSLDAINELILQKVPIITLDKWNYMTHENLDKVKPESLKSLLIKLKTHISFNQDEINRLVELHKGDKNDIIQFLNRNPILTTSDITDITDITSADIDKCINDINDIIYKELIKSINYSRENSIYHLIYDNADRILHIMQSNFMINHLLLVRNIISKGKDINENKFDIFKSLSYVDCPSIFDVESLLFMITFGNFYTTEQVERYRLMKESLNSSTGTTKFPVHHFMMGKGKSSVITPLIAINSCIGGKKTFIIVPTHLLEQTKETFGVISELYCLDNLSIITDYDAKLQLLQKGYDPNNIFIMDEIDMMIDPRTSNFQLVDSTTNIKMTDDLINNLLRVLLELVHINEEGINIVETIKHRKLSFLKNELLSVLKMRNIININYGMSKKYPKKRLAIPYMRKDTPLENSEFSSQIVTFVMTFLYFFAEGIRLDYNDFKLIYTISHNPTIKLLDTSLLKEKIEYTFIENATQYYNVKSHKDKVKFVLEYLKKYVFPTISMPADKKTCSFVDIMGLDSLWWGIGYSGTVYVDFPELCDGCKGFDSEVIADADEHISMDMIFQGTHENTRDCKFMSIEGKEDIWAFINRNEYDALIDLGGFFKDDENHEIVKRISDIPSYKGKIFVYLDNNDKKKIYDGTSTYSYSGQEYESGKVFYFYSQKNTVGVDFRQPSKMKCLLAINRSATMSQVAQASWRARKLIQGHTIDMVIDEKITTGPELQELLNHNSQVYRNNQKSLLDYQTLKWTFRRNSSDEDKYFEQKIPEKYLFSEKIGMPEIIKLMKLYIAHNNKKIWQDVTSNLLYNRLLSNKKLDNIVLGTSSSQHTETTQEEEQQQEEQQQESNVAISSTGSQNIGAVYPGKTWFFLPGKNLNNEIEEFTQVLTHFKPDNRTLGRVRLLLSSHSFYPPEVIGDKKYSMVFVGLTKLDFLVVNLNNDKSFFYYDKFPMYNVYGNIINEHALRNIPRLQECIHDAGGGCKEEHIEFSQKIIVPEILTIFDNIIPENIDLLKRDLPDFFYNYIFLNVYSNSYKTLYSIFPIKHGYNEYVKKIEKFLTDTNYKCNTRTETGITRLEELYIKAAEYNKDKTPLGRYGEDTLDDLLKMYEFPS